MKAPVTRLKRYRSYYRLECDIRPTASDELAREPQIGHWGESIEPTSRLKKMEDTP